MGCNDPIEKITPPASDSGKEAILKALGYEEKEVTIDGEEMTILVQSEGGGSDTAVVGTAIVGTSKVG